MYGYTVHVPAPIEVYHALHKAIGDISGEEGVEGLILHFAHGAGEGFAVTEVWESKEQVDAFNQTVLPQAMERAGVTGSGEPEVVEFDPVAVITPRSFTWDRTA